MAAQDDEWFEKAGHPRNWYTAAKLGWLAQGAAKASPTGWAEIIMPNPLYVGLEDIEAEIRRVPPRTFTNVTVRRGELPPDQGEWAIARMEFVEKGAWLPRPMTE